MSDRELFPLATALTQTLHDDIELLQAGSENELLEAVTPVTSELLRYWFQDDFCGTRSLNFHVGQRQAIVAIIYAHEVLGSTSLLDLYQRVAPDTLLGSGLLSELKDAQHQHPKYAAKMATGTGKTWVLNALLIWQYLNHVVNPSDRRFTRNFLLVAPGLIVYDRLLDSFQGKEQDGKRDFASSDLSVYQELFIPETYREAVFGFVQSSVVTKSEIGNKITGGGLIAVTNWHLLSGDEDDTFLTEGVLAPGADIDERSAVESFFPITPGTSSGNNLAQLDRQFARGVPLQSLVDLDNLLVFNDEAHHIHSGMRAGEVYEVEWQKSLNEISSTKGNRFIQVDFSATPFNEVGSGKNAKRKYFPHIVVDFDLRSAMRNGLVKSLALDKRKEVASLELDFRAERDERNNVVGLSEGQRVMLNAGLTKLNLLEDGFQRVNDTKHPKMLVVCEDTKVTPFVVEFFKQAGLGEDDILRVDSNRKNEVPIAEWAGLRERLFNVDDFAQPKVIISVLMLREGFDVNNICVIVPLRASEASILLEQTIGRGLRLMWRGEPEIDVLKQETRARIVQKLEPTNYFDVLFIIEHPAFSQFYDELVSEGLAGEVADDPSDGKATLGEIEVVELRPGYEQFDFLIPMILRDEEEEMEDPSIDPGSLPTLNVPLLTLLSLVGTGDRFVSEDAQTRTQFGDYRVDGGIMTATGYNDYLSRMTRRIAEALNSGLTRSSRSFRAATQYPGLQVNLALLTGWLDTYIRERLFEQTFDPLEKEHWRVLLIDDVARHIAGTFASALVESENNIVVASAEVRYRALSEIDRIPVRSSSCVEVTKSIYPKLPIPKRAGGLERTFIEWADQDGGVLAFAKIHEYKHDFLQHRYLKEDGMPGMYSPDFLLRTADRVYVIETKAKGQISNANVQRKRKSAKAWCDRINQLSDSFTMGRMWSYVILGEDTVK